jgi:hypothetical protein
MLTASSTASRRIASEWSTPPAYTVWKVLALRSTLSVQNKHYRMRSDKAYPNEIPSSCIHKGRIGNVEIGFTIKTFISSPSLVLWVWSKHGEQASPEKSRKQHSNSSDRQLRFGPQV